MALLYGRSALNGLKRRFPARAGVPLEELAGAAAADGAAAAAAPSSEKLDDELLGAPGAD
jgi:hypothetical protein